MKSHRYQVVKFIHYDIRSHFPDLCLHMCQFLLCWRRCRQLTVQRVCVSCSTAHSLFLSDTYLDQNGIPSTQPYLVIPAVTEAISALADQSIHAACLEQDVSAFKRRKKQRRGLAKAEGSEFLRLLKSILEPPKSQ